MAVTPQVYEVVTINWLNNFESSSTNMSKPPIPRNLTYDFRQVAEHDLDFKFSHTHLLLKAAVVAYAYPIDRN